MFIDLLGEVKEEKDLIVFDIPQLTVYRDSFSNRYLALVEDDDGNDLLFSKVSIKDLIDLLECRIPLRDLFLKNEYDYSVVWSVEHNMWMVTSIQVHTIPDSRLPLENACFDSIPRTIQTYLHTLKGFSDIRVPAPNYLSWGDSESKKKTIKKIPELRKRRTNLSSTITNVAFLA